MLKINILFNIKPGAAGGGNQFLKALREQLLYLGHYVENPLDANIVLFNSSPEAFLQTFHLVFKLKKQKPSLIFINRIDGPIFLIRKGNLQIDKTFFLFSDLICAATIFQSHWSKNKCLSLGMKEPKLSAVIHNASSALFSSGAIKQLKPNTKCKIIATSWSSNLRKGFDTYKWLDDNLNFERYEFDFYGNSPYVFNNIKIHSAVGPEKLKEKLLAADVYITASQTDPCSNALIEAISLGLPSIALNDGGHPELVSQGGELFTNAQEIPELLNKLTSNYSYYVTNINSFSIQQVTNKYLELFEQSFNYNTANNQHLEITAITKAIIFIGIIKWKITGKYNHLKRAYFSTTGHQ